MPSQYSLDQTYLGTALLHAKLSKAIRKQTGAVLVTENGVTLTGYNGTPAGLDNDCEHWDDNNSFVTKPEVIHAELNCLLKASREGVSVLNSTMYITLSPCVQCAAMMIQAGIKRVVYLEQYRCTKGLDLLEEAAIIYECFKSTYTPL